ncbi:Uncharacterised protein [BD1-7 clade bacterium]|uniref:Uncharacterized protein n=1 Tax=BD1-7 clade bacterium TaxID=2029982 RepID=A0A5S9Q0A8_9GAMM|nr:Uncharacterised protein [BD1-7 clade bacterium]CAA0112670.1 Uncharacterised protein [BD1-7 clade bacterium]
MSYLKKLNIVAPALLASTAIFSHHSFAQDSAETSAIEPEQQPVPKEQSDKIGWGPFTVGGAIRANFVIGSYDTDTPAPSRGGQGGDIDLDVFRINVDFKQGDWLGKFEYRWYNGYNLLHTGWVGYQIDDNQQVRAGVTRVPFGPGPYGVSQSWFFDQHYYVGLADDQDTGFVYASEWGNWLIDVGYFISSEGNWRGDSADSARYSYDAVRWTSTVDENGTVTEGPINGYEERNQLNLRAIYQFSNDTSSTDLGFSLQAGQLKGTRADDGNHWAASVHMVNTIDKWLISTQLTRYQFNIDANNPWGTDELIPMGAFDFAWTVASNGWIPAMSVSYTIDTPFIRWLDYILPYIEYSSIIKDDQSFNDSQLITIGAAWASGGWYIYSDVGISDGNYFVGNDGDNYNNIDGIGGFGANGNDEWNYRFNINFGYYF